MTFIYSIKKRYATIVRFWKNYRFRQEVRREKKRKYLFHTTKEKGFFAFFPKKKKRLYYFNAIFNVLEKNKTQFRLSFVLIGSFLLLSSAYIFFFSPYFRISPSRVIIERIDTITDINIAYKSIEDVYGNSIFSIDKDAIVTKMTDLQKNLKQIHISRLFPNGLKIITESYLPQFFVHFPDIEKNYIITENGILVYQKTKDTSLYTLELIDNRLSEIVFIEYKEVIQKNFMQRILSARDVFKKTFPTTNIAKFIYFQSERELHIALESGTIVIIRIWDDILEQISLLKFYNDSNQDIMNSGNIQYVDIRVLWKIFTCGDKNLCKKNLLRIYGQYYK